MADIRLEKNFEEYISRKLENLHDWEYSRNDDGFDPQTALYWSDFVSWLEAISPEKVEKAKKSYQENWENVVRLALVKNLEDNGTIYVLRHGFGFAGLGTIECSGAKPEDERNPRTNLLYKENILRVMRQVHYQTAGDKSLDLVFFINGIPVATAELKSELTQSYKDAIEQYKNDRLPVEPGTNRKNYLLMYKRGAIVHFAMSEEEVWMCTNLSGRNSRFLPFNKGNAGHAGNPPMQKGDTDYPTGYFWNDVCQRDAWLDIFHGFIFEEKKTVEDATGRKREVRTQIFPRYHQWDCVTKVVDDITEKRTGAKYLIEHSAGSGKTATISWLAYKLSEMRTKEGERYYSSVFVVTDSLVLDTNLKDALKQLSLPAGVIATIGGDGHKKEPGSKSSKLEKAIEEKRQIIIVTLQTFPYAVDVINSSDDLKGSNFAVLIDEAHRSQTGKASGKMKSILKLASEGRGKDEDIDDEDVINAYLRELQNSRAMPSNISFLAFTATPKQSTFELFGTPSGRIDEKTGRGINEAFHLYPMRQAIEEGYILDVLKGYMPYKTAYHLDESKVDDDSLVSVRQAKRTIAHWMTIHPTNVTQKVEFIVQHFVNNVAKLLNGEAKAMVVTSSRAMVLRYKAGFDHYLKKHPEYAGLDIEGKLGYMVIGEPLVAFSGKVKGKDAIMKEDKDLDENPFSVYDPDSDYDEMSLNPPDVLDIEKSFDSRKYRMLIVANKFQTGFNQKRLVAMYVDKKIANEIEIVQTYSRLNRTMAGKDRVFIIDFVNDPDQVYKAFRMYDSGAELESAQDFNVVYEIKRKLDDMGIYDDEDLSGFKKVRFKSIADMQEKRSGEEDRKELYAAVARPADRWNTLVNAERHSVTTWKETVEKYRRAGNKEKEDIAHKELEDAQERVARLEDFRKLLARFCSAYAYISQIISFDDPDLESFSAFAEILRHRLDGSAVEDIDITGIVLIGYMIEKLDTPADGSDDGTPTLKPIKAGGNPRAGKLGYMKDIVSLLNEAFGIDTPTILKARVVNAIADTVAGDDAARLQVRNTSNSKDAIVNEGRFRNIIKEAAVALRDNEFSELANKVINDPQTISPIASLIYDLVKGQKRIDIEDLADYMSAAEEPRREYGPDA